MRCSAIESMLTREFRFKEAAHSAYFYSVVFCSLLAVFDGKNSGNNDERAHSLLQLIIMNEERNMREIREQKKYSRKEEK